MDPRQQFVDSRLVGTCIYCGAEADTRDHAPSKALLDHPLPKDLAVVGACAACNASYSEDEEYVACLLDCVLSGTADAGAVLRERLGRALARNEPLAEQLRRSSQCDGMGTLVWAAEPERIHRIIVKLARGHAAYWQGLVLPDDPTSVGFQPLSQMSSSELAAFETETAGKAPLLPEVGSRAFFAAFGLHGVSQSAARGQWVVLQPGRYRHLLEVGSGVWVRIVLSEYLACSVEWA